MASASLRSAPSGDCDRPARHCLRPRALVTELAGKGPVRSPKLSGATIAIAERKGQASLRHSSPLQVRSPSQPWRGDREAAWLDAEHSNGAQDEAREPLSRHARDAAFGLPSLRAAPKELTAARLSPRPGRRP